MKSGRTAVTGMGVVSPVGVGIEAFWDSLVRGRSGIGLITQFDASTAPVRFAAEVKADQFEASRYVANRKSLKLMSKISQFAVAAADMALKQSGLDTGKMDPARIGVCLGSAAAQSPVSRLARHFVSSSGADNDLDMNKFWTAGQAALDPMDYLKQLANMPACHVAINFQLMGPNNTIATACAAGTQAIGEAHRTIQRGDATVMLAGGADTRVHPDSLIRFALLGALSRRNDSPEMASRPFDAHRDGFVLAEGSGVVVLEDMDHAIKRSAPIYAEVVGYGSSSDAFRLTDGHPEAKGSALAISAAMRDGGIKTSEVGYINAHGTSTMQNDRIETLAIKRVFGPDAYRIPVSSTKSMTGHLISAAGAVEMIACVLAMQNRTVPPTINYETADECCDLDYVPNQARAADIDIAISNSFGFGGQNAVIAVRKV